MPRKSTRQQKEGRCHLPIPPLVWKKLVCSFGRAAAPRFRPISGACACMDFYTWKFAFSSSFGSLDIELSICFAMSVICARTFRLWSVYFQLRAPTTKCWVNPFICGWIHLARCPLGFCLFCTNSAVQVVSLTTMKKTNFCYCLVLRRKQMYRWSTQLQYLCRLWK